MFGQHSTPDSVDMWYDKQPHFWAFFPPVASVMAKLFSSFLKSWLSCMGHPSYGELLHNLPMFFPCIVSSWSFFYLSLLYFYRRGPWPVCLPFLLYWSKLLGSMVHKKPESTDYALISFWLSQDSHGITAKNYIVGVFKIALRSWVPLNISD